MRKHILPVMLVAACLIAPAAAKESSEHKVLREAEAVLRASVTAPDRGIPKELLGRSECIGVFPGLKKAAFIVGGEFGRGVFTCRGKDGAMTAPAFFTMGGPSVGWQFGGEEADLVLLVMNEGGLKHLLQDRFTLGAEVSAAAGPVGRTAQAGTDAQMQAQVLSWSRSRGLFVGASLEGIVVKPNARALERFYEKTVSAKEILVDGSIATPPAARRFVKTTASFASRS